MLENSVRIVNKGDIALVEFDLEGEKANKLTSDIMVRLKEVCEELNASDYKAAVLISRKKKIFVAGADINEIKALKTAEDAAQAASQGQAIINMFEDLKVPVVAAIHGACLGGGCELVLACDYRLGSDDKSTKIGLPEVRLGVIPGFGGCVRLPRVVGLQSALDIILAGKSVIGKKALKIGLIDKLVPTPILETYALQYTQELIQKGAKKRKKNFKAKGLGGAFLESPLGRGIVFSQAQKMLLKQTKGHYPAPQMALEVIKKTYGLSQREKALAIEAQSFSEVASTEVSKHLINLFFMMEAIKKQTGVANPDIKPRKIHKMAVLGAGTMGGGIAQLGADKGYPVRMKDITDEAIALGLRAANKIWQRQLKRRRINKFECESKLNMISGGTNYDGFGNVDFVVEAIVEDMDIKKAVIGEAAAHLPEDAIVVTNTSSLSVTEMAEGHPRPGYFAGMHFFNPVHKMPLVEVIRGEKTSDETVATVFDLCKRLGKTPVVMKDGPGFLVNRLLLPYLNEAVYLLEDGFSIEEIDKAFLDFGMPMGPLHLLDEIGIDVGVKVAKIFHNAFGERAKPSSIMVKVGDSGRCGKKNNKGFYNYDERGKKQSVDQSVYKDLGLSSPSKKLDGKEAIQRGVFAMINEAALAFLEDRIVEKPEEVDLAMIFGTGFPPFRGGLLRYADTVGSEYIVDTLEEYAAQFGSRFKASNPLRNMAKTQRSFY